MNTKLLWIVIAIIVVAVGAWFVYGRTMEAPVVENVATTTPDTVLPTVSAQTHTVTYTDTGFSPASTEIAVGDTVRFVNESTTEMWVGADEHPTHTSYDGTSTREHCADGKSTGGAFDQCARSAKGTSWSYTFTKAGSFDYHNHARSADGGTIVVR